MRQYGFGPPRAGRRSGHPRLVHSRPRSCIARIPSTVFRGAFGTSHVAIAVAVPAFALHVDPLAVPLGPRELLWCVAVEVVAVGVTRTHRDERHDQLAGLDAVARAMKRAVQLTGGKDDPIAVANLDGELHTAGLIPAGAPTAHRIGAVRVVAIVRLDDDEAIPVVGTPAVWEDVELECDVGF